MSVPWGTKGEGISVLDWEFGEDIVCSKHPDVRLTVHSRWSAGLFYGWCERCRKVSPVQVTFKFDEDGKPIWDNGTDNRLGPRSEDRGPTDG